MYFRLTNLKKLLLHPDLDRYMKADISARIKAHSKRGSLKDMRIFLLHMNFWTEDDDFFAPAEIGLVEMTLAEGVINVFSQMVDPGEVPIGYNKKSIQLI